MIDLALWAVSLALMPYLLIRRRSYLFGVAFTDLFYGALLAFLMLSIGVMIGINTPNPENVIFVQIATFGSK